MYKLEEKAVVRGLLHLLDEREALMKVNRERNEVERRP